ncbi:hypothetical protein ACFTAO_43175 [Paenibacillus rhizoplanae]
MKSADNSGWKSKNFSGVTANPKNIKKIIGSIYKINIFFVLRHILEEMPFLMERAHAGVKMDKKGRWEHHVKEKALRPL